MRGLAAPAASVMAAGKPCPLHFLLSQQAGSPAPSASMLGYRCQRHSMPCCRRLTQVCQAAPTERAPRTAARGGRMQARAAATLGVACGRKASAVARAAAAAEPLGVMAACRSLLGAGRLGKGPGRLGWGWNPTLALQIRALALKLGCRRWVPAGRRGRLLGAWYAGQARQGRWGGAEKAAGTAPRGGRRLEGGGSVRSVGAMPGGAATSGLQGLWRAAHEGSCRSCRSCCFFAPLAYHSGLQQRCGNPESAQQHPSL